MVERGSIVRRDLYREPRLREAGAKVRVEAPRDV
jgi:hypothetical protein